MKVSSSLRHRRVEVEYLKTFGIRTGFTAGAAPFEVIELHDSLRVVNMPVHAMENVQDIVNEFVGTWPHPIRCAGVVRAVTETMAGQTRVCPATLWIGNAASQN